MSQLPWKCLQPSGDPNSSTSLRVDSTHPWDFFWAVSMQGWPQLTCRLPLEAAFPSLEELPRLKKIDVKISALDQWRWCVVELQDRALEDIFHVLCRVLVEAARKVDNCNGVMPLLLRHLKRWQQLLGKGTIPGLLSLQEQIGLMGELLFLRDYLLPALPTSAALESWVAPQEHPQDFQLPHGAAVEIKCRQATSPEMVHISSQWQLHQETLPLFLVVLTVARCEAGNGDSLYSIVQGLRRLMENDPNTLEAFEVSLFERGYVDHPDEYGCRHCMLRATQSFQVGQGFPRIVPGELPTGILQVVYTISLPDCLAWEVELDKILH